jgi:hypothetical protein
MTVPSVIEIKRAHLTTSYLLHFYVALPSLPITFGKLSKKNLELKKKEMERMRRYQAEQKLHEKYVMTQCGFLHSWKIEGKKSLKFLTCINAT